MEYCSTTVINFIFLPQLSSCGVYKNFSCLFTDAVSCRDCTASVIYVNIEHWRNGTDKVEPKYWDIQVCPCVTSSNTNSTYRLT